MGEVSLADQLACARRELAFRQVVYPRWIKEPKPKITHGTAERELARMAAIIQTLELTVKVRPLLENLLVIHMRDYNLSANTCTMHFGSRSDMMQFMQDLDVAREAMRPPIPVLTEVVEELPK